MATKPKPKTKLQRAQSNPLMIPVKRRMEQGSAAQTIYNRLVVGKPAPVWALKSAGIRKRRAA